MGATSGYPTAQPYSRAGLLAKLTGAAVLAAGSFLVGDGTSQLASTGAGLTYASNILTVGDGTGAPALYIKGAAGSTRSLGFYSGSLQRWLIRVDGTTESGGNSGSAFQFTARDDSGALIDSPLQIIRAAGGAVQTPRPLQVLNATAATNTTTGALIVSGGAGIGGSVFSGGSFAAGTALSAWGGSYKVLELTTSALADYTSGSNLQANWLVNAYDSSAGGYKYKISGAEAVAFRAINSGGFYWNYAASGTAGSAISWTQLMQLSTLGNLTIGGGITTSGAITVGDHINFNRATGTIMSYGGTIDDRFVQLSGGKDGASGANFLLYGGTHATLAGRWSIRQGATERLSMDGSGNIAISKTTASTSTTTGALTIAGGLGVAGALNIGGLYNSTVTDSATNSVSNTMLMDHATSGTAASGFGTQIAFRGHSASGTMQNLVLFSSSWVVATDASRTSRVSLYACDFNSSSREFIRGEANGSAAMVGFLGAAAVLRQTVGVAATDAATTQTLANNIRAALINLGLCAT